MKIQKIYFNRTNKEGQEYFDKKGQKFTQVVFTTEDNPTRKVSVIAYQDDEAMKWKIGTEIEGKIIQKGNYFNLELPRKENPLFQKIKDLEMGIAELFERVEALEKGQGANLTKSIKELKGEDDLGELPPF